MTGLCECGCGEATPIAVMTRTERGQVRGQPLRFVNGHNARLPRSREHVENQARVRRGRSGLRGPDHGSWRGDAAGYDAIHKWLNEWYPRTGVCAHCGRECWTNYAFRHHPEPHTRLREDYIELCASCHKRFDGYTADQGFHNAGWAQRKESHAG